MRGKQDGFEDDGDGPPPGWEFHALSQALPSQQPLYKAGYISPYFIAFSL